ncbi:hypothetical protein SYNPS1DRAFT_23779 [Syncephalis pseudoplumigaleata]|uniref:PROP1-like PPR domain-containing protein n=1 Tax=Syncephalis pseudoplumigaleata TaxID=1712513 RepID=A0A4P9YVQ4_9FUNG|nr:hypothetical protein SYNPS1DRAFT_23779 [Syncephalis pseudoplumigaleata]|eukprot:RKP24126.1 hypothetical protein SYNPS1DRAFT_23779 [Syncephalis pseudoplumigaleata]
MPRQFEHGDVYWRRAAIVELVAKKLAIWLRRFRERNGAAAIDWVKDVMPVLALDKQVHLGRGWHSLPYAKHLAHTAMHPRLSIPSIRDMIRRLMRSGVRADVFLYAVLTNAAARVGDGEMAWQGLRRLAWLEAIPTNNLYTHVIQRLTAVHEEQERARVPLKTTPPPSTGLREISELELTVMREGPAKCQSVFVDRAPYWIEQVVLLMRAENEEDNALIATCRLVACVCNGGRPALDENMLARVTKQLAEAEESVDESTLAPEVQAVWRFERLYAELARFNLLSIKPIHSRVLDILLCKHLLDHALAWHMRLSRSLEWKAMPWAKRVRFSIGREDEPDVAASAQPWDQLKNMAPLLKPTTAAATSADTLPSYLDACNRLLVALIRAKRYVEAVAVYDDLVRLEAVPDQYTLCTMAFCCAMSSNHTYLKQICDDFVQFNMPVSIVFYNGLLSVLVKRNEQAAIRQFYTQLADLKLTPNRRTFHLLLASCAKIGDTVSAHHFYAQMTAAQLKPTTRTFAHLLDVYARHADVKGAMRVMRAMQRHEVPMAIPVANALLSVYARTGNLAAAKRCFQLMLAQPLGSKLRPTMVSYLWLFRAYYWEALRRRHPALGHTANYASLQSFITIDSLTYSADMLQHLRLTLASSAAAAEPPALPTALAKVVMERMARHNAGVVPDAYFAPVSAADLLPAIDTPWQLFRCMTAHDGVAPNSVIYDTLLATLAIHKEDVEFKHVYYDLHRRAAEDAGLLKYRATLAAALAKKSAALPG